MGRHDWRWKINEAITRIRTRYDFIGRKTGAPFLALVYSPDIETAVLKEWRTQTEALRPEIDVRPIDAVEVTHGIITEFGAENIVESMANPMPGSDPESELGQLWIRAMADAVQAKFTALGPGKPAVSLERMAALYPAAGPRSVMQRLWDSAQSLLDGPVIVLIPGHSVDSRTYAFVGHQNEFMYRGDLL